MEGLDGPNLYDPTGGQGHWLPKVNVTCTGCKSRRTSVFS